MSSLNQCHELVVIDPEPSWSFIKWPPSDTACHSFSCWCAVHWVFQIAYERNIAWTTGSHLATWYLDGTLKDFQLYLKQIGTKKKNSCMNAVRRTVAHILFQRPCSHSQSLIYWRGMISPTIYNSNWSHVNPKCQMCAVSAHKCCGSITLGVSQINSLGS